MSDPFAEFLSSQQSAESDPFAEFFSVKKDKVPNATVGSVAQDTLAGVLQIVPTAIKGGADIARLVTGDRVGKDTSDRMESDIKEIQNDYGSERSKLQREKFQRDMADDNVSIKDALLNNKGALADQILPTIGSMFLPVGAAGVAGKVATMGKAAIGMDSAAIAARVASAQVAANVGTVAAQNAADTFTDLLEKGHSMGDAYLAAGITVPFSVIAGKLTGGGAEGTIAKAMAGSPIKTGVQQVFKGAAKEGAQEMGEELGQITGEAVGTGEDPSLTSAGKRMAVAGTLGAVMGGGVDAAAQIGQKPISEATTVDEAIESAQASVSSGLSTSVDRMLTDAVTAYRNDVVAGPAPTGSFDQHVSDEMYANAGLGQAVAMGDQAAITEYLRSTATDQLVVDLTHADQATFETVLSSLSDRARDSVMTDLSAALTAAPIESIQQSPGYAAQIEMQRRTELQKNKAFDQQQSTTQQDKQKNFEQSQIVEQARDQNAEMATMISEVNESPAAPTTMAAALEGAKTGLSRQEQMRAENAKLQQRRNNTLESNRVNLAEVASEEQQSLVGPEVATGTGGVSQQMKATKLGKLPKPTSTAVTTNEMSVAQQQSEQNELGNFTPERESQQRTEQPAPTMLAKPNNTQNATDLSTIIGNSRRQADPAAVNPQVAEVNLHALSGKTKMPKMVAQTIQQMGKMLGRKIVFVQGEIGADGAVTRSKTDNRVFINVDSGINPIAVLGHEMTHRMKTEMPKVYANLKRTLREGGIITDEMLADFDADYNGVDYQGKTDEEKASMREAALAKIKSDEGHADDLLEEMLSDLSGNRFTEGEFWTNVFQKIEEREGRAAAKPIITRLREAIVMTINKIMAKFNAPGFKADQQVVDHLNEVKAALESAYADYMTAMKDGVEDAEATGGEGVALSSQKETAGDHKMQITREERELADKTKLTREELSRVSQYAKQFNLPAKTVEMEVRRIKARFPESAGWAPLTFLRVDPKTMSKKAKENNPLPSDAIFFEPYGYQFHLDESGKDDAKNHDKRVNDIAAKLAGEILSKYMAAQQGDKTAQVIMRQADWYQALRGKLRATFGGFGDFLAQLLGPTSANNPVEPNFKYAVEALKLATSGKWDNMFKEVFAWKADMEAVAKSLDDLNGEYSDKLDAIKQDANDRWGVKSNKEKTIYVKEQTNKLKAEYAPKIEAGESELKKVSEYKGTMPIRENDKQFGMATKQIVDILAEQWGDKVRGDAPKTKNYYQNIMGRTFDATIDVWAARTLRRLANDVIGNLPRVPPVAETAVAGNVLADNVTSGSEFGFGQDVFRKAAEDLRASGVEQFSKSTPDAIQAMVWFIEKETWATRNWTTKIGEEGSIEHEMLLAGYADREQVDAWRVAARAGKPNPEVKAYLKKDGSFNEKKYEKDVAKWEEAKAIGKEMLAKIESYPDRYVAGATMEIPGDRPLNSDMASLAREIEDVAADDKKVMAMRAQTSTGEFMGDFERTLDVEVVARNGYDAMPLWNKLVEVGDREGQMATFLSRVLREGESIDPLTHRPGVELYFAKPITLEQAKPLMDMINEAGVHGMTMVTEGRRTPSAMAGEDQGITGIRMQHIPEFSLGYGYNVGSTDAEIVSSIEAARATMTDLVEQLDKRADVSTATTHWYETRVHFYGDVESKGSAREGSGASNREAWSGQRISEALESADRFARDGAAPIAARRAELLKERAVSRSGSEQAGKFSQSRSNAGSTERSGSSADSESGQELPSYGVAKPGAVSVVGTHYSGAERTNLDGRYYGTGARGDEAARVKSAPDPRIKERIYFYVDSGKGVTPEQGVGSIPHSVKLDNVYDLDADTWIQKKLPRGLKGDELNNAFESAVLDSGFDGYVSDFGTQRAAVLLGRHNVQVTPGKSTVASQRKDAPTNTVADEVAARRNLPMGKMSGADWMRMVPEVTGLNPEKLYYKDDVVAELRGSEVKLSPNRVTFDTHGAFWNGIRQGKNEYSPKEIIDALGTGRRGTTRQGEIDSGVGRESLSSSEAARVTAEWNESIAGYEGYVSTANTFPEDDGLETFVVSFIPQSLWGRVNPSDLSSLQDASVTQYAYTELPSGEFELSINDPARGSKVEKQLKENNRLSTRKNGYTSAKLDDRVTETRAFIQDSVRRLAMYQGVVPNVVQTGRGSGARAGSNERVEYPASFIEGNFSAPRFYSQLERGAEQMPSKVSGTSATNVKLWLNSNKSKLGIKDDEIQWSGINEYLDLQGKNKVSKDDVLNYLQQNGVKVEEVEKGGKNFDEDDVTVADLPPGWEVVETDGDVDSYGTAARRNAYVVLENGRARGFDNTRDGAVQDAWASNPSAFAKGSTKYGQYVLPGGDDYRELLLTLPVKHTYPNTPVLTREQQNRMGELNNKMRRDGNLPPAEMAEWRTYRDQERAYADELEQLRKEGKNQDPYRSAHWEEDNILAHIRFNEREDADGNRVLFVEELQSDWGQDGKKKGFMGKKVKAYEVQWEGRGLSTYGSREEAEAHVARAKKHDANAPISIVETEASEQPVIEAGRGMVPPSPFVTDTKSWLSLGLKRLIAYAVENGYDKVAFVNGEQSADRYSLAKKVDQLSIGKYGNGYQVIGRKNGDVLVDRVAADAKELESLVGKDIAEKHIETGQMSFKGVDLELGGKGMKTFYNEIVPQTIRDVLKKVGGGKVEEVKIGGVSQSLLDEIAQQEYDDSFDSLSDRGQDRVRYLANEKAKGSSLAQTGFTITPEMKAKVQNEGMPLFSRTRSAVTNQPIVASWASTEISSFDNIARQLQDKLIDTKRVLKSIRDTGKAISDAIDPYLQEILYHGRAAKRTQDFAEQELRPLLQDMQMRGIEMQEVEDYLWASHAIERNRQTSAVGGPANGSGMSDQQARDILAGNSVTLNGRTIKLAANKMTGYQAVANRVKSINDKTLDTLVEYGLETRQTVNAWKSAYRNYVPLMRDMEDDNYTGANNRGLGTGKGFSVRGSASKRAIGSNRGVVDIMANIAMQRERAITRGEKNRVSQATYGLALAAPNPDFWLPIDPAMKKDPAAVRKLAQWLMSQGLNPIDAQNIAQEPVQQFLDPRTGVASLRVNPMLRNRDDVLSVRINGEDKFLMFSSDERAQAMVSNLKNLDDDQLGGFLQASARVTRWFASVNTQYNPVFGLVNGVRDFGSAMLNLEATPLKGQKSKVAKYGMEALRGIYIDLRDHRAGKTPTSAWAMEFEEFAKEGGQTGYRDMFNTAQDRTEALSKELERLGQGKGKAWLKVDENNPIFAWLSDYNTSIENAFRLAAYKAAKEDGMTKQQAAALAKNLTVNFNKKGLAATQTGALYAFFNAAVQGTARIGATMLENKGDASNYKDIRLSPLGKKIILGGLTLGVMQAVMGALAGWDDEEPKQYQREKNFIIPLPGTDNYISIPMPLGFHVIPNIGRITTELVLSGFKNPGARMQQLLGVFAEAFNPIGSAGMSLQTIAPTFADPLVALATNKDWNGQSIAKEDFNKNNPTPGWTRAKDAATPWAKALSYGINYVSGGGEYGKGSISPTPDQIDYMIGQVSGGVGREIGKVSTTVSNVGSGEELPLYKVPVVGRFVGETTGVGPESGRYYRNLELIGAHKDPIKRMREDGAKDELQEYMQDNPEAALIKTADSIQQKVSELRTQKRKVKAMEDYDPQQVRVIDERIKMMMRQFNEKVRALEENPS